MQLDDIIKEIEAGVLPHRAADLLPVIAAKYSRACDNYIVANAKYAKAFNARRDDFKSDTATERALDHEEIGLNKHMWKYQIKKCEQIIKSLNAFIYQKTAEARNEQ